MPKAPCEPSAGDVGEDITLIFNNMLKYLDFFHGMICYGGKIYSATLFTFLSFLVLLCSDG